MIDEMFVIGCWPDSPEKMDTLRDTIRIIQMMKVPILLCTHSPRLEGLEEGVDYILWERKNVMSGDFRPVYWRKHKDGRLELARSRIPYHGVAVLNNIRNAVDFCVGRAKRIHYLEYDVRLNLAAFIRAQKPNSVFSGIPFDGDRGIRTDVWSADTAWADYAIPRIDSWEEYMDGLHETQYVLEHWLLRKFRELGLSPDLIDMPVRNLYDQVDKNLWRDIDAAIQKAPQQQFVVFPTLS